MALVDEVINRFSVEFLKNLTNPDLPEGSAYDAARLALAATDATAEFEREGAVVFSLTNAHHVDVAVDGVVMKLMQRGGTHLGGETLKTVRERFLEACKRLSATQGGRTRVQPSTRSPYTPSEEAQVGEILRPPFDSSEWPPIVPGSRPSSPLQ